MRYEDWTIDFVQFFYPLDFSRKIFNVSCLRFVEVFSKEGSGIRLSLPAPYAILFHIKRLKGSNNLNQANPRYALKKSKYRNSLLIKLLCKSNKCYIWPFFMAKFEMQWIVLPELKFTLAIFISFLSSPILILLGLQIQI